MSEKITLKNVCKFLKKQDDFIILTHISPDGDTLGSAYALALGLMSIGKKACVVCSDDIPPQYDFFVKKANLRPIDYKTILAVDVADAQLLGPLYNDYADKIELNIDHHVSNTGFAKRLYLDTSASATAECIYDILKSMRIKINSQIAECLYTGISTDTGCFKYSNVTAKTHKIAAELHGFNIDAAEINRIMFDTKSKARIKLERMVLDSAEFHFNDRCMLLTVTEEMKKSSGCTQSDLDGVASISRSVEGVMAGVSVKQSEEDTYKISLRTYDPLDASEICKKLGGGGHKNAAGCSLSGTLTDVKQKVLDVVKQSLEELDAGTFNNK